MIESELRIAESCLSIEENLSLSVQMWRYEADHSPRFVHFLVVFAPPTPPSPLEGRFRLDRFPVKPQFWEKLPTH